MSTTKQSVNEQINKTAELQFRALAPMRIFGGLATDAMEQVMRKNYEVMGDIVDFSIQQTQLPVNRDNKDDVFSAQLDVFNAFGEQMRTRMSEYVELAGNLSEHAREATSSAAAEIRDVTDDAADRTRRAVDEAVVYTQEAAEEATDRMKQAADEGAATTKQAASSTSSNAKSSSTRAKKGA